MKLENFKINHNFYCGNKQWRCTDIGSRTITAICLSDHTDTSWFNGPPYAVPEISFDEEDIKNCKKAIRNAEKRLRAVE